jgi:hypothetical protein
LGAVGREQAGQRFSSEQLTEGSHCRLPRSVAKTRSIEQQRNRIAFIADPEAGCLIRAVVATK